MSLIGVASTLVSYKMDPPLAGRYWLTNARELAAQAADDGHETRFFAALETDARGLAPFEPLLDDLRSVGGRWWTFSLNTGADRLDTGERLAHIVCGRNLVREWAVRVGVDWLLCLDSDTRAPDDAVARLLEMDWPAVGLDVPTYQLSGPDVTHHPHKSYRYGFPVQEYEVQTAGLLMLGREVFRHLAWRYDPDAGLSDDPAFCADVRDLLGLKVLVRRDVTGQHWPESIPPIEHRGHDLTVRR